MKKFDIPDFFRSSIISEIKQRRKLDDPRKKDFAPTILDFGPVQFIIARHFGFCYGVENAIDIAYKAIDENPGKKIFLLSEMIHNPLVNDDLRKRGINFIMDNYGNPLLNWNEVDSNDVVIIPAFGTTIETENILREKGIDPVRYNTTCPFVERVWSRAEALGEQNFTVIIHGKSVHEETRATFSHTTEKTKAVVVRDLDEAVYLSKIILGEIHSDEFYKFFSSKYSAGFEAEIDLERLGVVNQTTMLASETLAISELLRETMIKKYGEENIKDHFADTRDTLCYATNDNQSATQALIKENADLALVIGGYNSSNTTHLYEILEKVMPVYFISGSEKIKSQKTISHFNIHNRSEDTTENYLPETFPVKIAVTSGASCPDSVVDDVLKKILSFYGNVKNVEDITGGLK